MPWLVKIFLITLFKRISHHDALRFGLSHTRVFHTNNQISASISAGVHPEDAMDFVITIAKKTKEEGGILDTFKPGFSLIDQVDGVFQVEMQKALGGSASPGDYDNDLLMNRIGNGRLLIGLTDRNNFNIRKPEDAYVYVDKFRDINDICSACILSSYIPFGTGPLTPSDDKNTAAQRAWEIVKEMERKGQIKHGLTGEEVKVNGFDENDYDGEPQPSNELRYLDGGLSNNFPQVDEKTLIVSPINGVFSNPFIAPSQSSDNNILPNIAISDGIEIGVNSENLVALYQMARSSSPEVLYDKFRDGHDDAMAYLKDEQLLIVFRI